MCETVGIAVLSTVRVFDRRKPKKMFILETVGGGIREG